MTKLSRVEGDVVQYIMTYRIDSPELKQIAQVFQIDPSDVERIFRHITGRSVKKYIDEQRKRAILEMLKKGDYFGYEIADRLKFKDERAFYRWAKRVLGMTFREFCRKN